MNYNDYGIGNREIKFRAWDKLNKIMIDDTCLLYPMADELDKLRMGIARSGEIILMQYTGKMDKNGEEIYEGDIVIRTGVPFDKGVVYYHNGLYKIKWYKTGICPDNHAINFRLYAFCSSEIERIGNIFENPNLIK